MLDFTGLSCPVCGKTFLNNDDVVVCPDCGAPYHRQCYQAAGTCIFPQLHEKGEEWRPPIPVQAEERETVRAEGTSAEIKDLECPVCGTLNAHSALYCNRCGTRLDPTRDAEEDEAGETPPFPGAGAPMFTPRAFAFDPMGGVNPTEQVDEGVSFGEISKLVRTNTNYYMPVFRYLKLSGRDKFSFCAFLFSGAWMLYRKQYRLGGIVTAVMLSLHVLFQSLYWLVAYPALETLIAQAGYSTDQVLTFSNEQYMAMSAILMGDSGLMLRMFSPFLVLLPMLAVMIFVGVRGNRLYLNHCTRTVREIKAEETDLTVAYTSRGGINSILPLCVAILYTVIRNIFPLIL